MYTTACEINDQRLLFSNNETLTMAKKVSYCYNKPTFVASIAHFLYPIT